VKGKRKHEEESEDKMHGIQYMDDNVSDDEEISGDSEGEDVSMDSDSNEKIKSQVWLPGINSLGDDEVLECEKGTYTIYQTLRCDWPCLSFDIIRDSLGQFRTRFPLTMYMVVGSQASNASQNQIQIFKFSDIYQIIDDSSDEDSDDPTTSEPVIVHQKWPHPGGVNRIRSMPQHPNILASWSDTSNVHLWDCSQQLRRLDRPSREELPKLNPMFTFTGHPQEGFAMDWSISSPGSLITGDCTKYIYSWKPHSENGSSWIVDKIPYIGHSDSVEDLQWSPNEPTVFASCSVDKTIRIWDIRVKKKSMLFIDAHETDVNVISWNKKVAHLLVSGADDGSFKVWDLRNFKSNSPAANFKWHTAPISSVEWHPTDDSVIGVSSADNTVSIWDMSIEADTERKTTGPAIPQERAIPPELLFLHQGQKDIKELHWHPWIPSLCITTALDGINLFKPANMTEGADKNL